MMENSKERRPFIQRWQSGSVIRNWGTDLIFLSSLFGISPFSLPLSSLPPLFPSGHHRATKISHSNQSRTGARTRTRTDVGGIFFPLLFSISRGESAHQARLPHSVHADPKNAIDLSGAKSGSADDDNNSEESGLQIRHLQSDSLR